MNPAVLSMHTPAAVLIAFLVFVGASLLLCVLVGPEGDRVSDFYTANRSLTHLQNGLALSGEYISAATLLGTTGVVALAGYDGFALSLSTLLALGVMLLLAQRMRNAGRYTLGDILALRAPGPAPRIAAAVATIAVALPFLTVQLSGAGSATALLLGYNTAGAQQFCTALIGLLMICYTVFGGMKGTSLMQIVKVLLTSGTVVGLGAAVLSHFHWDLGALLDAARAGSGRPQQFLRPGLEFGRSTEGWLDFVGLQVTVVLGAGCMPQMVLRVSASPDGVSARRASHYALIVVAATLLGVVVLGLGAAALVGDRTVAAVNPNGQAALMLLAGHLFGGTGTLAGSTLFTVVACAVFVTVLAVVAGITLASAAGLAHDLVAHAVKRGTMAQQTEVRVVRWSAVLVGVVGIGLAVALQGYNITLFFSSLSVTLASASVLPALVYSLFWRRFNRTGLLWTVYGGLAVTVVLQLFSPTVSGSSYAMFPKIDFHWFPLQTGGLISVPAAFLLGWLGSVRAERRGAAALSPQAYAAVEARILFGTGTPDDEEAPEPARAG